MSAPPAPRIRPAAPGDGPALARLVTQLGYPVEAATMERRLERLLEDEHRVTLVAELDGNVAGMVGCELAASYTRDAPVARLVALVVEQELRSRGLGAQLVRRVEEHARLAGATRLSLTSRTHRTEAHRFYERLGYVRDGVRLTKSLDPPAPPGAGGPAAP